jgi:hypothetical protein
MVPGGARPSHAARILSIQRCITLISEQDRRVARRAGVVARIGTEDLGGWLACRACSWVRGEDGRDASGHPKPSSQLMSPLK